MSAPSGPPEPDLLVAGEDRPPRGWSTARRRQAVAVAVALAAGAVVAGVLAQREPGTDARPPVAAVDEDVVLLSLLRSGQDGAPRYGPRPPGVHVVVGNAGPAPVRLLSGTLSPGTWQVEDPPDRELRPGRSVRLRLLPPAGCGSREPQVLRVQALSGSGRPAVLAFDLADADLAYGGDLDDAVAAAALVCEPTVPPVSDGRGYPDRSSPARPSR